MYDLVIKNGLIVTEHGCFQGDVALSGETIAAIGQGLVGLREIPAEGKLVLPGGIDIHTHMALPVAGTCSSDDFYTGTIATACGGITTIADFTVGSPDTTLQRDLETKMELARDAVVDYTLHCEIVGWHNSRIDEMRDVNLHGVGSFKFFTAYGDSGRRTDNGSLFEALRVISSLGGVAFIHAEDDEIIGRLEKRLSKEEWGEMKSLLKTRPDICEGLAISTVSWLGRQTGARIHIVHLSSALGLEEVIRARRWGTRISTETCPQYLMLTKEVYGRSDGHLFSASPSLKTEHDRISLWKGLLDGDIDLIATDHCPFTIEQKKWRGSFKTLPYGLPGVETSRTLLYSEGVRKQGLSLSDFVRLTSGAPARLMGLFPRKGILAPGADGDVVIFDPEKKWVVSAADLHMAVNFSPYEGFPVVGKTWCTISRGEIIVENCEYMGMKKRGHFLQNKRETGV